jgi:transposase-like protein
VLKRSWTGEVPNVSLLVAIEVNGEGYREILGICEGVRCGCDESEFNSTDICYHWWY